HLRGVPELAQPAWRAVEDDLQRVVALAQIRREVEIVRMQGATERRHLAPIEVDPPTVVEAETGEVSRAPMFDPLVGELRLVAPVPVLHPFAGAGLQT